MLHVRSSASNKQVPDYSGSNEKRFLKGRTPAFFRHKTLRACYGYAGPSRSIRTRREQQMDPSESELLCVAL